MARAAHEDETGGATTLSERQPRGREPEDRPPHERETEPYLRAARFAGEQPAGAVYQKVQSLLYHRQDVDLSAFRLQLNQVYHVAVLGLVPPENVDRVLERLLSSGETATLPADVVRLLSQRRAQESQRSSWVEKHYRPGKRFTP